MDRGHEVCGLIISWLPFFSFEYLVSNNNSVFLVWICLVRWVVTDVIPFTEKYTLQEKSCDDSVKLVSDGTSECNVASAGTGIDSCEDCSEDCGASTLLLIIVQEGP